MLTEREAIRLLAAGDIVVGPMTLRVLDQEKKGFDGRFDMVVALEWEGRSHQFMVEFKAVSTPRMIENAITQLRRHQPHYPDLLPMVVAPVLTEPVIKRLIEEKVSGIDLSGNYIINVPGEWFLLHSGRPNKFPMSQPIKGIYEGTSSLVGRVLLRRGEFETAKDLQAEIERRGGAISKGTVSKVLKALDDELIIQRNPTIRLLQPELLLDRLTLSYRPPLLGRQVVGKAAFDKQFLPRLRDAAMRTHIRVVGRDETLYTVAPSSNRLSVFYLSDIDPVLDDLPFEPDHRFPNVVLFQVAEKTPYFDSLIKDEFPWCSWLQIYLELMQQGNREHDAAGEIRGDFLRGGGSL